MSGYKSVENAMKTTVFPGLGITHLGHETYGTAQIAHRFKNEDMLTRYGTKDPVVAAKKFQDELTRIFDIKNPNFSISVEKYGSGKFRVIHPARERVLTLKMPASDGE